MFSLGNGLWMVSRTSDRWLLVRVQPRSGAAPDRVNDSGECFYSMDTFEKELHTYDCHGIASSRRQVRKTLPRNEKRRDVPTDSGCLFRFHEHFRREGFSLKLLGTIGEVVAANRFRLSHVLGRSCSRNASVHDSRRENRPVRCHSSLRSSSRGRVCGYEFISRIVSCFLEIRLRIRYRGTTPPLRGTPQYRRNGSDSLSMIPCTANAVRQ